MISILLYNPDTEEEGNVKCQYAFHYGKELKLEKVENIKGVVDITHYEITDSSVGIYVKIDDLISIEEVYNERNRNKHSRRNGIN